MEGSIFPKPREWYTFPKSSCIGLWVGMIAFLWGEISELYKAAQICDTFKRYVRVENESAVFNLTVPAMIAVVNFLCTCTYVSTHQTKFYEDYFGKDSPLTKTLRLMELLKGHPIIMKDQTVYALGSLELLADADGHKRTAYLELLLKYAKEKKIEYIVRDHNCC